MAGDEITKEEKEIIDKVSSAIQQLLKIISFNP